MSTPPKPGPKPVGLVLTAPTKRRLPDLNAKPIARDLVKHWHGTNVRDATDILQRVAMLLADGESPQRLLLRLNGPAHRDHPQPFGDSW